MLTNRNRLIIPLLFIIFVIPACSTPQEPIRVGILHSLSGTMAVSESPVVDATLMAIDEINLAGAVVARHEDATLAAREDGVEAIPAVPLDFDDSSDLRAVQFP